MSKLTPAEQGFVDGIRSVIEADQLPDDFVQLAKEMINEIIASTPMLRARIPLSSDDLVYSTCYDVGRTWGEDARDDADILGRSFIRFNIVPSVTPQSPTPAAWPPGTPAAGRP